MNIETIRNVVTAWAAEEQLVEAVYLFGSYAKGCAGETSDVDLAFTFRPSSTRTALGVFIEDGARISEDLGDLLGKDVQVEPLIEKAATVWAAVQEHGIQIYPPPPCVIRAP
ncbi:nucleotidyltransferase family protein [Brevundimonas mediterranea]|jgi:predicted nucleotidyltransferase